jgi:excisionase family DNA binding protein
VKEELFDAEQEGWEDSPDGQAERARAVRLVADAKAEQERREKVWAVNYSVEWEEWQRLQSLLIPILDFGGDMRFDFDNFLMEVGRAPSPAHRVVRKTNVLPFQQGNLRWKEKPKTKKNPTPARLAPTTATPAARDFLTKQEVADRLQVSTRTVCRWRSMGLLKEFRRGQVLRFKREDVEAFEAKGKGGRR